MRLRSAILALVALTFCLLAVGQQGDLSVDRITDGVDRHYNDLNSLRAQFTETYRGAGVTRSESGTLWLRRPGKMRWEYSIPRGKVAVTDGTRAFLYLPEDREVLVGRIRISRMGRGRMIRRRRRMGSSRGMLTRTRAWHPAIHQLV